MRQKIVAGNWKMNTDMNTGLELAKAVNESASAKTTDAIMIIAPPYTHLAGISKVLTGVKLASQNCASEEKGAYTGEISVDMIKSTGAEYVIIGHSERREYFKEDNATLAKKTDLCLSRGLKPIFCIGENLEQRESGQCFNVIKQQLEKGLFQISEKEISNVTIAYEPVWAIGTGMTASPEQAQEIHSYIRSLVGKAYNKKIADDLSILYGGSCKPSNAKELFSQADIDGGLIGGAALKAEDFIAIAESF